MLKSQTALLEHDSKWSSMFSPLLILSKILSFFFLCFLAYSDDEKTIEEIIQEAEEGIDTYIKSPPVKIIPKMRRYKPPPSTSLLKMIKRKRKMRCKKCAGCLAVDCGKCNYCL